MPSLIFITMRKIASLDLLFLTHVLYYMCQRLLLTMLLTTNCWVQDVGVTKNYVKLSSMQRSFLWLPVRGTGWPIGLLSGCFIARDAINRCLSGDR